MLDQLGERTTYPSSKRKPKPISDCEALAADSGWTTEVEYGCPPDWSNYGFELNCKRGIFRVYLSYRFNTSTNRWRLRWSSFYRPAVSDLGIRALDLGCIKHILALGTVEQLAELHDLWREDQ